ncbi:MAG: 30S ribosomal protein S20 [Gemmatimonadetes bacterium]|nr:30S ribosomal protein S20 [Gemmatimonadota bacterium]
MARTRSAQKKERQDRKRRAHNRAERSRLRTVVKKVGAAKDAATTAEALQEAEALLDRLASRRLIHPNKAARKKSQLARSVANRSR